MQAGATELKEVVSAYPDLYHTGYTQDALKEVAEAFITPRHHSGAGAAKRFPSWISKALLISRAWAKPPPNCAVLSSILCDAKTRIARKPEALLNAMDDIYDQLVTFDFPDALTHGLRRQTDVVRGVLERTRGDLTQSLRQQKLQDALVTFEEKVTMPADDGG